MRPRGPRPEQRSTAPEQGAPFPLWHQCPRHPWLRISVLGTGADAWCIGDGFDIPGHWVNERRREAA